MLHRLALASAVAAMLASAAPGAFAQTTDTPAPPATTTPDTTTPSAGSTGTGSTTPSAGTGTMTTPPSTGTDTTAPMSGGTSSTPMSGSTSSMPMSGMSSSNVPTPPMNLPTDYRVLNNRVFDATDLEQARARGLSDNQIATVVRISSETTLPFNQVVAMVERGETFPAIATTYGLKLGDVYSNDKEKQQISDYDALSQYAKSLGKSDSSMMSMPMNGSASPMTPPMAPSAPPMTPTTTTTSTSPGTGQLDIIQTASAAKNLTTFVKAVQIAGLTETLQGTGPFTVFAPSDRAFAKLPAGALDALEADPARLKAVLTYHVIPANITAADATAMTSPTSPPTVEGATLQVTKGRRGRLRVNNATVTRADITASNGTIHIIDTVLMPPTTDTTTTQSTTDTTTPPAAPSAGTGTTGTGTTDVTPPAAPATPGTTDVTPVTPGTTNTPSGTTSGTSGATPGTSGATPGTTGATPATPGQ